MATNTGHVGNSRLGVAFAGVIVAGTVGIMIGSQLGWPWVTVGVPSASLLGYFLFGKRLDRGGISTAQFADSVYYLGFLFTLIALLFSLAIFGGDDGEYSVHTVVPQFGLALLTTVLGLAIRIYLVNFRPTGEDAVEVTEEALAEAAQALRTRLEQLSIDMLAQNELMNRSLKGAIDATSSELTAAVASARSGIAKAASSLAAGAERAAGRLETSVRDSAESAGGELRRTLAALAGETERLLVDVGTRRKEFLASIDDAVLPRDALVRGLEEPLAALREHVRGHADQVAVIVKAEEVTRTQAERLARAAESLATRAEAVAQSLEPLESAGLPVQKLNAELRAAVEALQDSTSGLSAHGRSLHAHAEGIGRVTIQIQGEARIVETHRESLERDVAAAEAALRAVHEQLVGAVRLIRETV